MQLAVISAFTLYMVTQLARRVMEAWGDGDQTAVVVGLLGCILVGLAGALAVANLMAG